HLFLAKEVGWQSGVRLSVYRKYHSLLTRPVPDRLALLEGVCADPNFPPIEVEDASNRELGLKILYLVELQAGRKTQHIGGEAPAMTLVSGSTLKDADRESDLRETSVDPS